MKKEYYVTINGERIPVREEVYRAYKQPAWREHKRRTARTQVERSLDLLMEDGFDIVDDQRLVDELVADKLLLDALLAALNELTDDERGLVDALYFHGLTERQAAELFDLSQKGVNKRKQRVLDKLRDLLAPQK
jgi:RNA polymerase sigma factor (sigma-70 family)